MAYEAAPNSAPIHWARWWAACRALPNRSLIGLTSMEVREA